MVSCIPCQMLKKPQRKFKLKSTLLSPQPTCWNVTILKKMSLYIDFSITLNDILCIYLKLICSIITFQTNYWIKIIPKFVYFYLNCNSFFVCTQSLTPCVGFSKWCICVRIVYVYLCVCSYRRENIFVPYLVENSIYG